MNPRLFPKSHPFTSHHPNTGVSAVSESHGGLLLILLGIQHDMSHGHDAHGHLHPGTPEKVTSGNDGNEQWDNLAM